MEFMRPGNNRQDITFFKQGVVIKRPRHFDIDGYGGEGEADEGAHLHLLDYRRGLLFLPFSSITKVFVEHNDDGEKTSRMVIGHGVGETQSLSFESCRESEEMFDRLLQAWGLKDRSGIL